MSARSALEPVLAASGLAVRDGIGGLSIGRADGAGAVETGELVDEGSPLLSRRRPDPGEAVARVSLSYADRERNYLSGAVTAISAGSGALEAASSGLVLDIGGARATAEQLLAERLAQRDALELTLPPSQLALEVGDAIDVAGDAFEVTAIRDGLARRISARAIVPPVLIDVGGERPSPQVTPPPATSLPVISAAHLPPAPEEVSRTQLALAAFARPWPGEVTITDDGTGASLSRLGAAATMGVLSAPLAAGSIFVWDELNAIELELFGGHLSSRDDNEVLAGTNRLAVETDGGEWETVGFANAELIAPRTYRLTRLLRGQGGTDHAVGPSAAGNRVLLLDGRASMLAVSPSWLDATAELRSFAGPDDGVGMLTAVPLSLMPILPLAPVHLTAIAAGSDIALSWTRRSHADTDSWAGDDAPLDWSPEGYRATIHNGPTLLRTIDVASPATTYTAAQQAADFGGPATAFSYRVAQKSATYGPGHWAEGAFNA